MTLKKQSGEYRKQAGRLRERIRELENERRTAAHGRARDRLDARLCTLREMWREARDIAVLTERYYERGYRKNGRYTL